MASPRPRDHAECSSRSVFKPAYRLFLLSAALAAVSAWIIPSVTGIHLSDLPSPEDQFTDSTPISSISVERLARLDFLTDEAGERVAYPLSWFLRKFSYWDYLKLGAEEDEGEEGNAGDAGGVLSDDERTKLLKDNGVHVTTTISAESESQESLTEMVQRLTTTTGGNPNPNTIAAHSRKCPNGILIEYEDQLYSDDKGNSWNQTVNNFVLLDKCMNSKRYELYKDDLLGRKGEKLGVMPIGQSLPAVSEHPSLSEDEIVVPSSYSPGFNMALWRDFWKKDRLISTSIALTGEWEPQTSFVARQILQQYASTTDTLFIDMGSNSGYYSLLALSLGFDVLSVEMIIDNAIKLARSAAIYNPGTVPEKPAGSSETTQLTKSPATSFADRLTMYIYSLSFDHKKENRKDKQKKIDTLKKGGKVTAEMTLTNAGERIVLDKPLWPLSPLTNDYVDNSGVYEQSAIFTELPHVNTAIRLGSEGFGMGYGIMKPADDIMRDYFGTRSMEAVGKRGAKGKLKRSVRKSKGNPGNKKTALDFSEFVKLNVKNVSADQAGDVDDADNSGDADLVGKSNDSNSDATKTLRLVLKIDLEQGVCDALEGMESLLDSALNGTPFEFKVPLPTGNRTTATINLEVLALLIESDHLDLGTTLDARKRRTKGDFSPPPGNPDPNSLHSRVSCYAKLRDKIYRSKTGKFYPVDYTTESSDDIAYVNFKYVPKLRGVALRHITNRNWRKSYKNGQEDAKRRWYNRNWVEGTTEGYYPLDDNDGMGGVIMPREWSLQKFADDTKLIREREQEWSRGIRGIRNTVIDSSLRHNPATPDTDHGTDSDPPHFMHSPDIQQIMHDRMMFHRDMRRFANVTEAVRLENTGEDKRYRKYIWERIGEALG